VRSCWPELTHLCQCMLTEAGLSSQIDGVVCAQGGGPFLTLYACSAVCMRVVAAFAMPPGNVLSCRVPCACAQDACSGAPDVLQP
jgi:hypothetical protein